MMDDLNKVSHIMPTQLPKTIFQLLKRDDKTSLNIRMLIVIAVFSLILILIGTIILLNSYTPNPTKISSTQIRYPINSNQASAIQIPNNLSKNGIGAFTSTLVTYATGLAQDESNFESSLKLK